MRIVYVAAGAAGMYCGSCLHDNALAAALSAAGEDVLLVPAYTPIRTDEEDVSEPRIVFGGINVYLQQFSPLFRYTPRFLERLLDSPRLLSWLSNRSASVDPARLGALTVSMLRGEEGRQRKELAKLVDWLEREVRPELVHFSNSMFSGMAREVARRLNVPTVCSLSGEDIFLEKLPPPHYAEARRVLSERCRDVEAFVALNRYYAEMMSEYLGVERGRVHVIPHGLKLEGHGTRRSTSPEGTFTIGYLARICPDKGLHQLVEAFRMLAVDHQLAGVRLRAAGYLGAADQEYLERLRERLSDWGLAHRFEYVGELDRREKIDFLQSLDVMSVPTVYRESKGISVLEAMANAVPVVLPAHGAFPELIDDTGGGLLCEPGNPASLAQVLRSVWANPLEAAELGRRGQQAIRERYTAELMAERTRALYRRLLAGRGGAERASGGSLPVSAAPRAIENRLASP